MEQTNRLILNDLIQAYKDQYGDDNWFNSLTQNLYPSPNQAIAARHGVSKTRVILIIRNSILDSLSTKNKL